MGFWDALFGRARPPRARLDALFSLATALPDIAEETGWQPGGRAGICLKPASGADFQRAADDLQDILRLAAQEFGSRLDVRTDEHGYAWAVFADQDLEDLVALTHAAATTLRDSGYGEQLLAALFRFRRSDQPFPHGDLATGGPAYLVYPFKRGAFYPFVPEGQRRRDTAEELRVAALLERRLPVERDESFWYPLWDAPV